SSSRCKPPAYRSAGGSSSGWLRASLPFTPIRRRSPPFGSDHHHIDAAAAAPGTDELGAPFGDGKVRTIALGLFGGIRLYPVSRISRRFSPLSLHSPGLTADAKPVSMALTTSSSSSIS